MEEKETTKKKSTRKSKAIKKESLLSFNDYNYFTDDNDKLYRLHSSTSLEVLSIVDGAYKWVAADINYPVRCIEHGTLNKYITETLHLNINTIFNLK